MLCCFVGGAIRCCVVLLAEQSDVVLFCWWGDQMLCCFVGGAIRYCVVLFVERSDVLFC